MDLIADYSSDSDDSVDVSTGKHKRKLDVEEEIESAQETVKKSKTNGETQKQRLPPPSGIKSMFTETSHSQEDVHTDNPSLHGGKVRSFAHERGNWASYVYIPVDRLLQQTLADLTESLITELENTASFCRSEDFHVSLSRTFVLRHHWIDPLMKGLTSKLSPCKKTSLHFTELEYYTNDEKTRTFIGLCVGGRLEALRSYVSAVDASLSEFRLPLYYEKPSFHISLAWAVGDQSEKLTADIKTHLDSILEDCKGSDLHPLSEIEANEIHFKTGNKLFRIGLGS